MEIMIGGRSLAMRRPADLDTRLVEASGCDAAETSRMMGPGVSPATVARVMLACVVEDGGLSVAELAAEISAAGTGGIATQVAVLLETSPAEAAEPEEDAS